MAPATYVVPVFGERCVLEVSGGLGDGECGGDAAILQMKMYLSSQFWSDQPHEPLMDWLYLAETQAWTTGAQQPVSHMPV
jgi:hypothetical protein